MAEQLDTWYIDGEGRCWRRGTPWPALPSPPEEWQPLPRAVIKAIRRGHAEIYASPGELSTLIFYVPGTGQRAGTAMDARLNREAETMVRVPSAWYPDDVDLPAVRVDPVTGKVSPVRLLPDAA